MKSPIVVLVGAGASYASADVGSQERTPLTRDLFDCFQAQKLLAIYTLAREARGVIKREMAASDTTIAFEEALRKLETDGHRHHEQMALAVPPFLQALLLQYSSNLDARCDRYGTLVDELLKLQTDAVFVSLKLRHAARQSTRRILAAQLDERLHRNAARLVVDQTPRLCRVVRRAARVVRSTNTARRPYCREGTHQVCADDGLRSR